MSASANSVIHTTSTNFREVVLEVAGPVLVDFTASWCAPCRALAPVLEELGRRHAGRVRVAVVDAENSPELAQAYRVTAMPTLIAFHRGQVVAHAIGFGGRARVEKLFDELAALPPSPTPTPSSPTPTPSSRPERRAP